SCRWRRRVCSKDIPPLIGPESKAARASCLTFSLLVVSVCQQSPSAFAHPAHDGPNFGFAALARLHYCAAMLLARITSAQSLSSCLSNTPAASGLCRSAANTSIPPSSKVLRTLAPPTARLSPPFTRPTTPPPLPAHPPR